MNQPQHQLTGSEELLREIADLLRHKTEAGKREAVAAWHTKHLAKARQAFLPAIKKARVEARLATIDAVFELSPTKAFEHWKPSDALRFYARLKEYEKKIQAQLASMEKTDDK